MRILTKAGLAGILLCGSLFAVSTTTTLAISGANVVVGPTYPCSGSVTCPEFGKSTTLTATVTSSGSPVTTGTVAFFAGTPTSNARPPVYLGSATLSGSGTAAITTISLPLGVDYIQADYEGVAGVFNASASSNKYTIVLTNNSVGFGTASTLATQTHPYEVAVGDINGDGIADLVVANSNDAVAPGNGGSQGTVAVYFGNGSGGFASGQPFSTVTLGVGYRPRAVVIADVNNDGKPDIVTANSYDNTISVLINQTATNSGTASFATAVTYPGATGTNTAYSLAVGDFNGDGVPDIAVAHYMSSSLVSIFLGSTSTPGTFGTATGYAAGNFPLSIAVGDFDGDGIPDLVTANSADNGVSVLKGSGTGTFAAAQSFSTGASSQPVAVAVGDFNGDGQLDIATADFGANAFSVLINDTISGIITFQSATQTSVGAGTSPQGIVAGNIDGLGYIATLNSGNNTISVFTTNTDYLFGAPTTFSTGTGTSPYGLAIGDFNGDGVIDFATANLNSSASVILGTPSFFQGNNVTVTWFDPNLSSPYQGPFTANATASPSQFLNFYGSNQAFNITFTDQTITISSAVVRGNDFSIGDGVTFNGLVITNPIPPYGSGQTFTGVQLTAAGWNDSNGNPFTQSRISFDSTHIYVDFQGVVNDGVSGIVLTVNPTGLTTTTTQLSGSPGSPAQYQQPIILTAQVSDPNATGTVSFYSNGVVSPDNFLGSASVANGFAAFTVPSQDVTVNSTATYVAYYNGNSTDAPSTSGTLNYSFVSTSSTTTLTSSANPSAPNTQVTLTATVTSGATGTVAFYDNNVLLGSPVTVSGGTATLPWTFTTAGSHPLVALYSGDANYSVSVGSLTQTVATPAATTTTLSLLGGTHFGFGKYTTLVATMTGISPDNITGTVTFFDGPTVLGSNSVYSNNGQIIAELSTGQFGIGTQSQIRARYEANGYYATSLSAPLSPAPLVNSTAQSGFLALTGYSVGANNLGVAEGDINLDGFEDLVTIVTNASPFFTGIAVSIGNGDGTFQPAQYFPTSYAPTAIAIADVNGDAWPDVVIASNSGDNHGVEVLLNARGDGGLFTQSCEATSCFSTEPQSSNISISDFNNDGIPDLLIGASGGASIAFGKGDGTFGGAQTILATEGLATPVAADFNSDGTIDLAVVDESAGTVHVFLGNGDGTFAAQTNPNLGSSPGTPFNIAIADFNNDGNPDFVLSTLNNWVVVALGNGNGTFQTGTNYSTGAAIPSTYSMVTGDFNGDGIVDVAVLGVNGASFAILAGDSNGDGGLQTPTISYPTVLNSNDVWLSAMTVGHFNNTGARADLAFAYGPSGGLGVMLGAEPQPSVSCPPGSATAYLGVPFTLSCSATNGVSPYSWSISGDSDLTITSFSGQISGTPTTTGPFTLTVQAQDSDSPRQTGSTTVNLTVVNQLTMQSSLLAPVLGKSYFETVAAGGTGNLTCTVTSGAMPTELSFGTGAAGCNLSGTVNTPGFYSFTIQATDSGTPSPQVVSTSYSFTVTAFTTTTTLTQTGGGATSIQGTLLTFQYVVSPTPTGTGTETVNILDYFNNNSNIIATGTGGATGNPQFSNLAVGTHTLTAQYLGDSLDAGSTSAPLTIVVNAASTVTLNTSPSTPLFGQAVTLTATITSTPTATSGNVEFLDGSTVLGSAPVSNGVATLTTHALPQGQRLLRALYSGNSNVAEGLSPPVTSLVIGSAPENGLQTAAPVTTTNSGSITFGDVNGDGIADMLVPGTSGVSVLFGNANGTFQSEHVYSAAGAVSQVIIADMNLDGHPDLVLATDSGLQTLFNDGAGSGTFNTATTYFYFGDIYSIAVADFDHDGYPDVLAGTTGGEAILSLNDKTGYFKAGPVINVTLDSSNVNVATADFDHDGNPDFIIVDFSADHIYTLIGDGNGSYHGTVNTTSASGEGISVISIATGDFNGDGFTDLVLATYNSNVVVLLGSATGALSAPVPVVSSAFSSYYLATGDFNGDGFTDIAVGDGHFYEQPGTPLVSIIPGSASVSAGASNGGFASPSTFTVASPVQGGIAVANLGTANPGIASLGIAYGGESGNAAVLLGLEPLTISCTNNTQSTYALNASFGSSCTTTGGTPPITFSVGSGTLPASLSLNPSTGAITGNLTQAGGPYQFGIGATDSSSNSITGLPQFSGGSGSSFSFSVINAVSITNSLVPTAIQNQAYSTTLTPSGGTGTGYVFQDLGGNLPPGLLLNTAGLISGTPTVAGTYIDLIKLTDSGNNSTTKSFSFVVNSSTSVMQTNLPAGYAIVNISGTQFGAENYNQNQTIWYQPFAVSGQIPEFTVQPGAYTFRVIDPADAQSLFPNLTTPQLNSIYTGWTYNTPWIESYLVFDSSALTNNSLGQIFSGAENSPAEANAAADYAASIAAGTYHEIFVGARNASPTNSYTFSASQTLVFAVPDNGLGDNAGGVSVLIAPVASTPLSITTTTLPSGFVGQTYSATLAATGGTGNYVWTTAGLPSGLTLSAAGVISGTAGSATSVSVSLTVTDPVSGASQTINPIITISALPSTQTSLSLTTGTNPSYFGNLLVFTATVSPTPSGTGAEQVQFYDGSTVLGSPVTMTGATATLTSSGLNGGAHSIIAKYLGDSNDAPSTSSTLPQTVNKATPALILLTSANPSTAGQSLTITAKIFPASAQGTVTFIDGSTTLGSATLSGGIASISSSTLAAGQHSLAAVYTGNVSFNSASSSGISTELTFNSSVGGSIQDSTGQGIGFTTRLPGTGGSIYGYDFNLVLNTAARSLAITATASDPNGQNNLGVAEFPGVLLSNFGIGASGDFAISANLLNITDPASADQFGLFIGGSSTTLFRGGYIQSEGNEAFTVQTNGSNDGNFYGSSPAAAQGDNVRMTLARTNGSYSYAIQDFTNPSLSASVGVVQPTYLAGLTNLVAGVYAIRPGDGTARTETVAEFSVATPQQIVNPGAPSTPSTPTYPPLNITTTSLPSGTVGTPYSASVSATGGTGSYVWSANGSLPQGVSFSAGSFSGTPQATFSGNVGITVTDTVSNQTTTTYLALQITQGPLQISGSGNLGDVPSGTASAASFTATGGAPGAYTWSVSGITGLSIDSSGNVRGTVSAPGQYSGKVTVTDSSGASASVSLSLAVLGISGSFPNGTTTAAYSGSASGVGGVAPYTFSASGVPQGMSFSGGTLSGTEKTAGSYTIGVTVTDANNVSFTGTFSFTITGPAPKTLTITTTSLPDGFVGQPYSQTLNAAGGNPGYTWAQSGGYMPPGLSLSSGGTISGTPNSSTAIVVGSYSIGVQVTDNSGAKVVGSVSFNIDPAPLQITSGSGLPAGQVTVNYPAQILTASGGVAPYTYAIAGGSLPAGIALTNGQIAGTPTVTGNFGFSVTVTDSSSPAQTATLGTALQVNPNAPDLVLSQASDSFNITAGTSAPPSADTFSVASTVSGDVLSYSATSSVPWLTVGGSASTPGYITVGPNSAALTLSTAGSPYTGTVTVTCTAQQCSGKKQTITVTLNITSPPPQISLGTPLLSFSTVASTPEATAQSLAIVNAGGGTLTINSVSSAASWITVGSFPSSVLPGPGGSVTITANPAGLNPGYYSSSVTVNSSAGASSVPVSLLIAAAGSMQLGPAGTQFSLSQGGAVGDPNASFLVSVSSGTLTYNATIQPGASWLSGGGSGTATPGSPGNVTISVNQTAAAALAQGAYYATVEVTGSGVINSPQVYQVVLNVGPTTSALVPNPSPAGVVFLTPQGSAAPAPQLITLYASSVSKVSYTSSVTLTSGSGWLSVSPASGSTSAAAPAQLTVSVNPSGLAPGVYTGQIGIAFGSTVSSVNVTLVVEKPIPADRTSLSSVTPIPETTATCSGGSLVPTQTGLVSDFSAPASWPTPLAIILVDTCGNTVGSGQVVTTFSNGDPPLILSPVDPKNGLYSGTWTPRKTSQQVTILARATSPGYPAATTQIAGAVAPNTAPQLAPNGTLDIFNPTVGAGLGPGNIVQIYGSGLANQIAAPSKLPLPTTLNGTTVLIGGVAAPLFYVSSGQINAQIPFALNGGNQYQVIVNANGALTTPQPINLTPAVPAILLYNSGIVVAQHGDGTDVTTSSPAAPGEVISFYLSGLGATDQDIPSGSPSPSNPPANVLNQPTLTLNGAPAQVLFAGLAPGFVGLYQMNFQVPSPLADGNYTFFITQGNVNSNNAVIPVQNPTGN